MQGIQLVLPDEVCGALWIQRCPPVDSTGLAYITFLLRLMTCQIQSKGGLFAFDRIIIPVHLGNHWTCGLINFKDKRIEFDGDGDVF
jgi:hypothetical protein